MPTLPHMLRRDGASPALPLAPAASAAPGALAPGTAFAGITIERVLARGAVGVLYLAMAHDTGAPVAVKVVPLAGPLADGGAGLGRDAFLREARTAMALRHRCIVTVHGVATLPGLGCTVMELLPGADLTRYVRPGRLLPEALALEVVARVAEALAHAHLHGVVHRDVKPANVMFDPAGGGVKLTDFGLARAADAAATRSGLLLGSPAYMAPEQLMGAAPTARSDLYALGTMAFELLAGRLPHQSDSMGELLRQVVRDPAPDLRLLRPELPPSLAALIVRLLSKRPAERPQDGHAVAEGLRAIARTLPGAA